MPEKAVLVFQLRKLALVEAVKFPRTLNAKYIFEAVLESMTIAGRVDQILGKLLILCGFVVKRRHLLESEILEPLIDQRHTAGILGVVVDTHDAIDDLYVSQRVQHGNFLLEQIVIVNWWCA